MTKPHSYRIQTTLTSSSMTPRSAQNYLAYLATLHNPPSDEILYTEAKLALGEGDTDTARTLFDQCPVEYKRIKRYMKQLDTYDALCRRGVIDRRDTLDVRVFVADILGEETTGSNVVRYADLLLHNGYNRRSLDALTMSSMECCMEHAEMNDGHRCLFEAAITKRTPCFERAFMTTLRALERCGRVVKCIKSNIPADVSKNLVLSNILKDEDGDDDDDNRETGDVDDDETTGE